MRMRCCAIIDSDNLGAVVMRNIWRNIVVRVDGWEGETLKSQDEIQYM